ncbi:MAG: PIN domain-containing protein [Planctomycetes bacterium]|nr:PIN domain-containing protein [Planctomycetota bacterium]
MSGNVFLDTNVLVYAIEVIGPNPAKSHAALELVRRADVNLSTQVLGEFYCAAVSSRRQTPLTHEEALAWVQFWKRHKVHPITASHVDLALELGGRFRIHYYDALILASARLADCPVVYSEDLNARQQYDGVRVENPFIV